MFSHSSNRHPPPQAVQILKAVFTAHSPRFAGAQRLQLGF
jgi:hypothetical protein